MARCISAIDDPESFIRGWFYGSPFELIKRENIREWLTCSFLCSKLVTQEEIQDWQDESDRYIAALEVTFNCTIPAGKTEDLPLMRLHDDPVNVVSRPLLWYMVSVPKSIHLKRERLIESTLDRWHCRCDYSCWTLVRWPQILFLLSLARDIPNTTTYPPLSSIPHKQPYILV